ncbi:MerR family transcriptional regulator [Thalassospira mesophila]|uniref:MerR family transcriptional regulator n=1 Tax=Thalassospira mesophila TaxID=1293891 RepID=UPI000A2010A9|nr:MerR family transcriptional regulator [Thalassospira mesophila]
MKNEPGETAKNRRTVKSDSAFRTISEAATELGLQQHVLRFWEQKFPQIKPMKRAGGRRYYRPDDIEFLQGIRALLHDQGYTIKGVQKLIAQNGGSLPDGMASSPQGVDRQTDGAASFQGLPGAEPSPLADGVDVTLDSGNSGVDRHALANLLGELEGLQSLLRTALEKVQKNP